MKTEIERKLYRKIYRFIRAFNPTVRLLIQEDEFCYMIDQNVIAIDLNEIIYMPDDEALDKSIFRENGLIFDIQTPTFYILHEIAHSLSPIQNHELYKMQSSALSLIDCEYKRRKLYREIEEEKKADELAYKIYLHNYDFVKSFDNVIKQILGFA